MDLKTLLNSDSVMDDVNDLDAAFGYFRPLMDDDEDEDTKRVTSRPRRGRPSKDPAVALSDVQKAERRAMLVEAHGRLKARQQS